MSKVAAESLVGTTLGDKYAIEAFIGLGAMGSVYRAHQTSLRRTVAIKVLHRHLAEQPSFVERFQREAFSASRLDHPNSLRILDFGQSDGVLYLVMEFVEGTDLLTVMARDWPFDDHRIVEIVSQTLAALATAHDLGIVHRDLKPENILLLRGTDDEGSPADIVKVCDFGIAKLTSKQTEKNESFSRHLTTEGFVIGTPDYMSPEQARGEEIDGRSDLYSVGVVLYQLLVGRLPFAAETPLGVVLRHISDPPPPPSSHAKVHERLESICMRALSKDARDRYQDARTMRRALRMALSGEATPANSERPPVVHSTDMTSVPGSGSNPRAPTASRVLRIVRSFRPPGTARGRSIAAVATALGFGGSVVAMRFLAGNADAGRTIVTSTTDTVLTNPSPPIAESTLQPLPGAPAADDPKRAAADLTARSTTDESDRSRTSDRSGSDRHHSEKTARSNATGAPIAAGPSSTEASPAPAHSPSAALAAAPSSAPTDTASASSPPDNARPAEPDPRAAIAPANAAKVVPALTDPALPSTAPPIDPSHASVAVGAIATTGGISAGKVKVALARVPFTTCYRKSLVNRSSAAPMEASLRLTIDVGGRVSGAALSSDGNLPGLRACIESEARGISIRDVDTGDGSAAITLTFSPR
jgi:serine/threonine-protein kinase